MNFQKIKPEHFDFLGLIVFPLIFCYAAYILVSDNLPPHITTVILLFVGIFGTLIDGSVIYRYFICKKK
jgi:hypothetical protein